MPNLKYIPLKSPPLFFKVKLLNIYIMTFQINNYGVSSIDWLINRYKTKVVTRETIEELKEEVFNSFINNPYIDFSTGGNVSVTIVDIENRTNQRHP